MRQIFVYGIVWLSEEERIIDDDTLKNKRKCILMIHPPVVIGEVSVFDTFPLSHQIPNETLPPSNLKASLITSHNKSIHTSHLWNLLWNKPIS